MSAVNLEPVKDEVLGALNAESKPISPSELVGILTPRGVREDAVRLAMWELIDRGTVRITDDSKVVISTHNG